MSSVLSPLSSLLCLVLSSSLPSSLLSVSRGVVCRCVRVGVCVRGCVWHAENLRVCIQHVPVCAFKTSPCVPAPRAGAEKNMWACCRYTRGRFERTHAGVLNAHTEGLSLSSLFPPFSLSLSFSLFSFFSLSLFLSFSLLFHLPLSC